MAQLFHVLFRSFFLAFLYVSTGLAQIPSPQPESTVNDLGVPRMERGEIDGVMVEYAIHRVPEARATLVFENGLLLEMSTWREVARRLWDCCNLVFYHRPGVGRSAFVSEQANYQQTAARLHRLLQAQTLPPPYVVVGHSLGGQYAQVFSAMYRDQVSGVLLVDALPVGIAKRYEDFPWGTRSLLWLFASASARNEIAQIHPMGAYLSNSALRFSGPMVRIVAETSADQTPSKGLIRNLLRGVVYAEDFGIWATDTSAAEQGMSQLYPQAEQRHVKAHHRVQEYAPDVVVAAIQALIDQATRAKSP